ncbi:hypothetical protein, partial [Microtetraspora niveoalba]|uniref:hypothetical protein n=1 Tax=Microtetraspora niveoalba TaxID=46175 RepID=UPI001471C085
MTDQTPPLPESEVLARPDLYGAEQLLGPGARRPRESGVTVARPYACPVPEELLSPMVRARARAANVRHYEVLFAFDLEEPPPGRYYSEVGFEVRLADDDAVALRVSADDGAIEEIIGVVPDAAAHDGARATGRRARLLGRLRAAPGAPVPRVFGTRRGGFGFTVASDGDRPLPRLSYGLRVLLELPANIPDLAGSLTVTTTIRRVRRA